MDHQVERGGKDSHDLPLSVPFKLATTPTYTSNLIQYVEVESYIFRDGMGALLTMNMGLYYSDMAIAQVQVQAWSCTPAQNPVQGFVLRYCADVEIE